MATATDFRLLGPLEVWRDGELLHLHAPRQRAVLALLLLRANEVVSQDELIAELWGEHPPPTARASLQNQIHALRQLLGDVLETRPPGYLLHVEHGQLDVHRFETLLEQARAGDAATRAARLKEALALWRGLPLVEFPEQPFAQTEIVRLEELRLGTLEERIEADLELGRHVELIPELEALVDRHPLRERLWGQLMLALYRAGRQAEALALYRRAHAVFVEELGIEPGPSLRELQRAILIQDPALEEAQRTGPQTLLERAARLLPGDERRRIESLLDYGAALWRLEERRESKAALVEAMRRAAAAGERALEERARLRLSWQAIFSEGRTQLEHLAQCERSAAVFAELGDNVGLAQALRWQAHTLRDSGHAEKAAELSERALQAAEATGDRGTADWCRQMLARSVALGPTRVREAIATCEQQLAALAADDPGPRDGIESVLAWLLAQAARPADAVALAEGVVTRVREAGDRFHWAPNAGFLAWVHVLLGDLERAVGIVRELVEFLESEHDQAAFAVYAADLARLHARLGNDAEAERLASSARTVATADDLYPQVLWRRAEALVRGASGASAAARSFAKEALALTAKTDHLTFHGETLEDAAEVERRLGSISRAQTALEQALSAYTRKGNVVGAENVRRLLQQMS